eukprot:TRINITY_DN26515_c0_g1_i1.p1 TRINITY_DN26515_c0_g1~~TRINITY_DN26515_c0_g1_i1.p1  ORF type:complete len:279 (-),score=70.59 TRINITY_DN26515_c0_g1_i1:159-995(-)
MFICFFFFQAEDGIRDAQESRGLGDVYKRQYQRRVRGDRVSSMSQFQLAPSVALSLQETSGAVLRFAPFLGLFMLDKLIAHLMRSLSLAWLAVTPLGFWSFFLLFRQIAPLERDPFLESLMCLASTTLLISPFVLLSTKPGGHIWLLLTGTAPIGVIYLARVDIMAELHYQSSDPAQHLMPALLFYGSVLCLPILEAVHHLQGQRQWTRTNLAQCPKAQAIMFSHVYSLFWLLAGIGVCLWLVLGDSQLLHLFGCFETSDAPMSESVGQIVGLSLIHI